MSRQKINYTLLDYAIKRDYNSRRAFAKEHNFNNQQVQKWCVGNTSPTDEDRKKLCEALDISEDQLLLSSLSHIFQGLEAALTRWSDEHQRLERGSLSDSDAIKLLQVLAPAAVEEAAEDESKEAPFFVQGPTEPSDSAEQ